MRKLLVSVLSIGLLAAPVALAFAADESRTDSTEVTTELPFLTREFREDARTVVREATQRAERKERMRERRQERRREARQERRREARQERRREARQAEQVATTEAAPVTDESQAAATGGGGAGGELASIRECESGGDYSANTGNGYYGAYQFTQETWEGVGGSGSPASASPAEQDAAAQRLMAQSGSSPWPVCGG